MHFQEHWKPCEAVVLLVKSQFLTRERPLFNIHRTLVCRHQVDTCGEFGDNILILNGHDRCGRSKTDVRSNAIAVVIVFAFA